MKLSIMAKAQASKLKAKGHSNKIQSSADAMSQAQQTARARSTTRRAVRQATRVTAESKLISFTFNSIQQTAA